MRGSWRRRRSASSICAYVEVDVGAVVAEAALVGHLHRRAAAALAADADAGGVHAVVAEGRGAAGADPAVAAVVALGLLGEALLEEAPQRLEVDVAERLSSRAALLVGEAGEGLRIGEPLQHLVGDLGRRLDALEDGEEGLVVGVEVGLALHQQARARW